GGLRLWGAEGDAAAEHAPRQRVERGALVGILVTRIHLADVGAERTDRASVVLFRGRERLGRGRDAGPQARRRRVGGEQEVVVRQRLLGERGIVHQRGARDRSAAGPPADQERSQVILRHAGEGGRRL